MNTLKLKENILKQVDSLKDNELQEFYGVALNYINSKQDISDWEKLSTKEKDGILDAINEIENGKGISNQEIKNKFKTKLANA